MTRTILGLTSLAGVVTAILLIMSSAVSVEAGEGAIVKRYVAIACDLSGTCDPTARERTPARPGLASLDDREVEKVRCGATEYYCPDHAPHCFLCRGVYSCCGTSETWRCC